MSIELCLNSGTYQAAVQQDVEEGTRVGVTGTPTFFHQWSAAGGRPAARELRTRERGGAGAGAVRESSHPSIVHPFQADPRRGWDRCRSSDMLFGSVKGGDVF